jgi:phosphatidylinositol alpha-mannosyltransferase
MRIAFISAHNFSIPGGVRTHILNLSKELELLGHKTIIIAPKKGDVQTSFNTNIPNLFQVGNTIHVPMNGAVGDISFFTNEEIYNILEDNKIDILHFHNFLPFISTDALMLAGERKKIVTVHTLPAGVSKRFVNKESMSKLLIMFDHTIFVSESQKSIYEGLSQPFSIIPNGIRVNNEVKPRNIDGQKKIKLLYVGRIEHRKGLDYLLKAFQQVLKTDLDVELHIVGSGDLELFKREQGIDDINSSKIIYHGRLSDDELSEVRKKTDIYISPAIMGESFGIVLLESMAVGVPVIAFDNPGYRTVLKNELGWGLCKNKDHELLAVKIIELINDKKRYHLLSKIGLSEVNKYSWTMIAQKVQSVYKSIE